MVWKSFDGRPYTREQFKAMVDAIPDEKLKWCKFLTLHHTASPSIAQWMSPYPQSQRIRNIQAFYEHDRGWSSGPHSFIPPDPKICHWGFTPFTQRGVHASCFNGVSIGLEMIGDFWTEEFHSGLGALVRDNAVYVLAVLHRKMGLRPDGFELGKSGLHFHTDCKRDGKVCPGPKCTKEYMVKAILEEMDRQEAAERAPAPAVVAEPVTPTPPVTAATLAIPAADGPSGYDPSTVTVTATKAPVIKTLVGSRTAWANIVALVTIVLGWVADTINSLIDSLGDVVKDVGDNLSSLEQVVGWFRGNWQGWVTYLTIVCIVLALYRHVDLKRIFLGQVDPQTPEQKP